MAQPSCPLYLSKRNETIYPHKDLHMHVQSSFTHNSPNLEAGHMFLDKKMKELWCIHIMRY